MLDRTDLLQYRVIQRSFALRVEEQMVQLLLTFISCFSSADVLQCILVLIKILLSSLSQPGWRLCFTTYPKNSKFIKSTPLSIVFSTIFLVYRNVVKHCV